MSIGKHYPLSLFLSKLEPNQISNISSQEYRKFTSIVNIMIHWKTIPLGKWMKVEGQSYG